MNAERGGQSGAGSVARRSSSAASRYAYTSSSDMPARPVVRAVSVGRSESGMIRPLVPVRGLPARTPEVIQNGLTGLRNAAIEQVIVGLLLLREPSEDATDSSLVPRPQEVQVDQDLEQGVLPLV